MQFEVNETFLKQLEHRQNAVKKMAESTIILSQLYDKLGEIEVEPTLDFSDSSVTVSFSGDKEKLKKVWGILRNFGYEPSRRPDDKPTATFSTFWHHPAERPALFLIFYSSVCKLKQVGTKTVEQAVYEVDCSDPAELNGDLSDLL